MDGRARSYGEFWPRYLREHARPVTRALHFVGTGLGLALLSAGIATLDPRLMAAGMVGGYLLAWIAHFVVERNRPATFTHPWWSLISDLRMLGLWAVGRLGHHLERCNLD